MFGDDDNLFDIYPDMDLDGDRDLVDALILDDIIREEEEENQKTYIPDLDEDDDEIFLEYGIDRDDFDSREEFLEAVREEKYGWRDLVDLEESIELNIDPEDYETEDEYNEAIEEAKESANDETTIEMSVNISFGESDEVEFDYDKSIAQLDGITFRHDYADYKLKTADPKYDSREEIERYDFIVKGESVASHYLTVDGVYLYAQAVKDHFKLPFDIPEEKDEIKTYFETLLQDLVECDAKEAMKIWEWCIDTFMPYINHAGYKNDLTHAILLDLQNFIDEFPNHIVNYMIDNPSFVEKIILKCTDSLWGIDEFVRLALEAGSVDTANAVMKCAFANPHTDVHDKARFIKSCIDECSNWEELETIELFHQHVFPIVYQESDVRIKNKIPHWEKEIREYIESIEQESERYQYSRRYAWRAKYKDAEESPLHFESEEDYLNNIEENKYRWRKYCSVRMGVSPMDFETRTEYDEAVREAYKREQEVRAKERAADPSNNTLYKFCKVSVAFPNKPFYYYLSGKLKLRVGDRVVVPFGQDNALTEAVVMSVGECYGSAFPCKVDYIKTVIALAVPDEE